MLDAEGFPCLAFLTSDIQQSLEVVRQAGATDILDPYRVQVGGKMMTISMFRTPTGALAELVRVDRKNKPTNEKTA